MDCLQTLTPSLLSWLTSQERTLKVWIAAAAADADLEVVEMLERHERWLQDRIGDLGHRDRG